MDQVPSAFLKAAVTAVVLVGLGVMVGLQMDDTRADYLDTQLRQTNLQAETFLVTNNYLEESSQNYCTVVRQQIPELARTNADIGRDLRSFSSQSISEKSNYEFIKRKYYVNQLNLYNVLRGYKDRCSSNATLIFFFFDDSSDSSRQGSVLTEYRKKVDNRTYVFSYNLETDDSQVLDLLKTDFQVEEGPTIVINGEKVYRRYVPLHELRTIIE